MPNSYFQIDFVCGLPIDKLGPAGSNIFYTPQGRLFSADNGDPGSQVVAPSSLSGYVYADINDNGVKSSNENGISGVTVKLSGIDIYGASVAATTTTNSSGYYAFINLAASSLAGYKITEVQPSGYIDGKDTIGSLGGTVANDLLTTSMLNTNTCGLNYNFGELRTNNSPVVHGDAATIGYWRNSNGQALIKSFNGASSSTALATWLANTFPNLYGSGAGSRSMLSNGSPLTNAQVAQKYINVFFNVSGQKTDAQVLATALAVYATSTNLSGTNTLAAAKGFNVSAAGIGVKTYNVGSNGSAFGVANNTVLWIKELLAATNSQSSSGSLYTGNQTKINQANTVYNGVNTSGDIALVADGSQGYGQGYDAALVSSNSLLLTGEVTVTVDGLAADQAVEQLARINDAIGVLNTQMSAFDVYFVLVSSGTADAQVHVQLTDSSNLGGVAEGVLGLTNGDEITLISGWNWYVGADSTAIELGQFDFQTVVTHEFGHVLGMGHSTDTSSVMFPELAAGQARRTLSAADLVLIGEEEADEGPEALMAAPSAGPAAVIPHPAMLPAMFAAPPAVQPNTLFPSTAGQIVIAPDAGFDCDLTGNRETTMSTRAANLPAAGRAVGAKGFAGQVASDSGMSPQGLETAHLDAFFSRLGTGQIHMSRSDRGLEIVG